MILARLVVGTLLLVSAWAAASSGRDPMDPPGRTYSNLSACFQAISESGIHGDGDLVNGVKQPDWLKQPLQVVHVHRFTDVSTVGTLDRKLTDSFLVFNASGAQLLEPTQYVPQRNGEDRLYYLTVPAPGESRGMQLEYEVSKDGPVHDHYFGASVPGLRKDRDALFAKYQNARKLVDAPVREAVNLLRFPIDELVRAQEKDWDQQKLQAELSRAVRRDGRIRIKDVQEQRADYQQYKAQLGACDKLGEGLIADAAQRKRRLLDQLLGYLDQVEAQYRQEGSGGSSSGANKASKAR